MAGGSGVDESQFKGWRKHFNTYTVTGRANITYVTLGSLFTFVLYKMLKPKKKPALQAGK